MRICKVCNITKSLAEFGKDKGCKLGHRHQCKTCRALKDAVYSKKRVLTHDHVKRKYNSTYMRKYGITLDAVNELKANQQSKCLICHNDYKLYVDHCHTTGEVRGLLCNNCNTGLGMFGDSIDNLRGAIAYLNKGN